MRSLRELRFHTTISDTDHWTPEHLAAASADEGAALYEDWAADQLATVMREAGRRFAAANPDLFPSGLD